MSLERFCVNVAIGLALTFFVVGGWTLLYDLRRIYKLWKAGYR